MVKKAFGEDNGKPSNKENSNMGSESGAYGNESSAKMKTAPRERAQTANKTGKPPLASTAMHNLGSAREKMTVDDSLTGDGVTNQQVFMEAEQLKVQLKKQ